MIPVARVGDVCVGTCAGHPPSPPIPMSGKILTGSGTTMIEGKPVARVGDTVMGDCGHTGTIVKGSSATVADGKPVARIGDSVSGVFTATIVAGASKTSSA